MCRTPKPATGNQDFVGTLKLVLEDEQQTREKLTANLQSTEQALAEREQKMKQFQAELGKSEEQAKRLEQERAALAQQASAAQASLERGPGQIVRGQHGEPALQGKTRGVAGRLESA